MPACRALSVALVALVAAACGSPAATPTPRVDAADAGTDGGDAAATCPSGEITVGDGCTAAGVPPSACADGFRSDGVGGCVAVVPDTCPSGQIARLGETACHEIAPCGDPPWGDIPVDARTMYVDATYTGSDADGTRERPYSDLAATAYRASKASLVALAAGNYADVMSVDGPVRIWGRCPALVHVEQIEAQGDVEIHTLTMTAGLSFVGHGTSLVDRVVLRSAPRPNLSMYAAAQAIDLHLVGSLIEGGVGGIEVGAGSLVVDDSTIRDTHDIAGDLGVSFTQGVAVDGQARPRSDAPAPNVVIRRSIIEGWHGNGISATNGAALRLDGVLVRATVPARGVDASGAGVLVTEGSTATIHASTIERQSVSAVHVQDSVVAIDDTTLRDVAPFGSGPDVGRGGFGVHVGATDGVGEAAIVVRHSLIERCHEAGVAVYDAAAILDGVLVRGGIATDDGVSFGLLAIGAPDAKVPTRISIDGSAISGAIGDGALLAGANVDLARTLVLGTRATPTGTLGDGVSVIGEAEVRTSGCFIAKNARAGLSNFGARASITTSTLADNGFNLDGEVFDGQPYVFDDDGGNACSTSGRPERCQASSSGLTPPALGQ